MIVLDGCASGYVINCEWNVEAKTEMLVAPILLVIFLFYKHGGWGINLPK